MYSINTDKTGFVFTTMNYNKKCPVFVIWVLPCKWRIIQIHAKVKDMICLFAHNSEILLYGKSVSYGPKNMKHVEISNEVRTFYTNEDYNFF